jgi:hypothetical protein
MFDIGIMMQLDCLAVDARAAAEGRTATGEEYKAALQKTWDAWMDASVTRDMTRAGFVKTATGWESPRRGFWARIFGQW